MKKIDENCYSFDIEHQTSIMLNEENAGIEINPYLIELSSSLVSLLTDSRFRVILLNSKKIERHEIPRFLWYVANQLYKKWNKERGYQC